MKSIGRNYWLLLAFLTVTVQAVDDASATTGTYTLRFSQQAIGAAAAQSPTYSIKSTLKVAASDKETQTTNHYTVQNPLAMVTKANTGLATGQGTIIRVSWGVTVPSPPPNTQGFNVYRLKLGGSEDFQKLNDAPVNNAAYVDGGVEPSTAYVYRIDVVDESGRSRQWAQTNLVLTGDFPVMTSTLVRRHLLGKAPLAADDLQYVDLNNDGKVDIADFMTLIKQEEQTRNQ